MKRVLVVIIAVVFPVCLFAGQLPSYQKFCAQLKNIPGWQAEKCEGMNMTGTPVGEMASATRSYDKGSKHIDVSVFCGMQAMGYWAPFASNMQVDSSEGFVKITTVDGFPVGIQHSKEDKTGGVIVCLDKKAGQHKAVFVVNYEGMGWKEALGIAKKFDWKAMEKLFK